MPTNRFADILMITYNRPQYTALALRRLLETCESWMRVWVWHNGEDVETLRVVESLLSHPRIHRFHHSRENVKLTEPTNWLWENAEGSFFGKVDDDCLMPDGWGETLVRAHRDERRFGILSGWHFAHEDFVPALARRKIKRYREHRILKNPWVGGSGYLMKRECVQTAGVLGHGQGFPTWCMALPWFGWVNGWYYPFVTVDHMDDPRSRYTLLRNDADILRYRPITATTNGVATIADWTELIRKTARAIQISSTEPCRAFWIRRWIYGMRARWLPTGNTSNERSNC